MDNDQTYFAEGDIMEGEVEETSLVTQEPQIGAINLASLTNLSKSEAVAKIENMAEILKRVRSAAILLTNPTDWMMYYDYKSGRTTCYLQDAGCQRVRGIYGICIKPVGAMELIPGDSDKDFAYSILGDGICQLTGERCFSIEGIKTSGEILENPSFSGLTGARLKAQVRKHTLANMNGKITRQLAGLSNVPIEVLQDAGMNTDRCVKARGFKRTAAEAVSQTVAQKCPQCGKPVRLIPAGKSDGKPFPAFYACTDRSCGWTKRANGGGNG